jgi:hypothetical protein
VSVRNGGSMLGEENTELSPREKRTNKQSTGSRLKRSVRPARLFILQSLRRPIILGASWLPLVTERICKGFVPGL